MISIFYNLVKDNFIVSQMLLGMQSGVGDSHCVRYL